MKISTVIPTYNRRARTSRAIDSVLAQTMPVDEIIVVDDGSTDGTADAICGLYGSKVTLLRQENAGVSAARNRGISAARGEWIAFLDSDDTWLPRKIERQMDALSQVGRECGLCFTDNCFTGGRDTTRSLFEQTGFGDNLEIGTLQDPVARVLKEAEPFFTSSLLVLRSLLTETGGFDESLTIREDTDLIVRLSFRTTFGFARGPFVLIDREPSRPHGLCNLYSTGDDRVFSCLTRVYRKWLAMPEIAGSRYEEAIKELLRLTYYNSVESKLRQLKIGPTLDEIQQLKKLGYGYSSIVGILLSRKIHKLRRGKQRGTTAVGDNPLTSRQPEDVLG